MEDLTIEKTKESCDLLEAPTTPVTSAPARDTNFANKAFNWLNYCGLGFLANSASSLFITYNVMPTDTAQKGVEKLANGMKPVVGGFGRLKNALGFSKKEIDLVTRDLHIAESARSTAEILVMTIAGTLMLFPMKWMEDHKKAIVERIDKWKNPEYHEHCQQNNITPEALPHEAKENKKSWGNLIWARAVGLASVLGIDAVMQVFNNNRHSAGKWNMDTVEWKLGGSIYDKLPKSTSEKFINFFSARKSSDLSGIQPQLRETLEKTVSNDKNRMMFAEQTRFLSKELSLTMIIAGIVYALAKTGVAEPALNKAGIKNSKDQHQAIDDMLPDVPFVPITKGEVELPDDKVKKITAEKFKKPKPSEKQESWVAQANNYAMTPQQQR